MKFGMERFTSSQVAIFAVVPVLSTAAFADICDMTYTGSSCTTDLTLTNMNITCINGSCQGGNCPLGALMTGLVTVNVPDSCGDRDIAVCGGFIDCLTGETICYSCQVFTNQAAGSRFPGILPSASGELTR